MVGSVMPALISPNSVATFTDGVFLPEDHFLKTLLIVGSPGHAAPRLLGYAAHRSDKAHHVVGRDPVARPPELFAFVVGLLAGPVEELEGLGGQLVVENVVGRQVRRLQHRFVVSSNPEAIRKAQGEVAQQPQPQCRGQARRLPPA